MPNKERDKRARFLRVAVKPAKQASQEPEGGQNLVLRRPPASNGGGERGLIEGIDLGSARFEKTSLAAII